MDSHREWERVRQTDGQSQRVGERCERERQIDGQSQ